MNTEKELERLHKIIEKQQEQIDSLILLSRNQNVIREYIPMPSNPIMPVYPSPYPTWCETVTSAVPNIPDKITITC